MEKRPKNITIIYTVISNASGYIRAKPPPPPLAAQEHKIANRDVGILGLSVSQKVDRGPEEGHGHGIYVIIVLIDSSKSDAKLMQTSFHETE